MEFGDTKHPLPLEVEGIFGRTSLMQVSRVISFLLASITFLAYERPLLATCW